MPTHGRPCLLGNTVANTDANTAAKVSTRANTDAKDNTAACLLGNTVANTDAKDNTSADTDAKDNTAANNTTFGDGFNKDGHGTMACMDVRGLPVYLFWGDGTPRILIPSPAAA